MYFFFSFMSFFDKNLQNVAEPDVFSFISEKMRLLRSYVLSRLGGGKNTLISMKEALVFFN